MPGYLVTPSLVAFLVGADLTASVPRCCGETRRLRRFRRLLGGPLEGWRGITPAWAPGTQRAGRVSRPMGSTQQVRKGSRGLFCPMGNLGPERGRDTEEEMYLFGLAPDLVQTR